MVLLVINTASVKRDSILLKMIICINQMTFNHKIAQLINSIIKIAMFEDPSYSAMEFTKQEFNEYVMLICQPMGNIVFVCGHKNIFQCSHKQIYQKNFFELMTSKSRSELIKSVEENQIEELRSDSFIEICANNYDSKQFEAQFFVRAHTKTNMGHQMKRIKVYCYPIYAQFSQQLGRQVKVQRFSSQFENQENSLKKLFVIVCRKKQEQIENFGQNLQKLEIPKSLSQQKCKNFPQASFYTPQKKNKTYNPIEDVRAINFGNLK